VELLIISLELWYKGTVAERTSSRLRRTNDRSVLGVHEDHEDDENAEIGVRQQSHKVVSEMRFELIQPKGHYPLKIARLPVPPLRQVQDILANFL